MSKWWTVQKKTPVHSNLVSSLTCNEFRFQTTCHLFLFKFTSMYHPFSSELHFPTSLLFSCSSHNFPENPQMFAPKPPLNTSAIPWKLQGITAQGRTVDITGNSWPLGRIGLVCTQQPTKNHGFFCFFRKLSRSLGLLRGLDFLVQKNHDLSNHLHLILDLEPLFGSTKNIHHIISSSPKKKHLSPHHPDMKTKKNVRFVSCHLVTEKKLDVSWWKKSKHIPKDW